MADTPLSRAQAVGSGRDVAPPGATMTVTPPPGKLAWKFSRSTLLVWGCQLLIVLFLIGVWQLVSGRLIPTYVISSPSAVASALGTYLTSGSGWNDIAETIKEVMLAYLFGEVAGLTIGILFGSVKFLGRVFEPLVAAANGIPHIALAPLFIIFLGIGIWSKVAIGAMICFFVMFYSAFNARKSVDRDLLSLVCLFGAQRSQQLRHVIVPSMAPAILAGLSAGIPFALIGVVVGEFIAAGSGVGNSIIAASDNFNAAGTYAGIIILLVFVLVANLVFRLIRGRALRWQDK